MHNVFCTHMYLIVAIDGGWSPWKEVVPCNATCGGGMRQLMRMCNSPAPANGGRDCEGMSNKADVCAECPCESSSVT